MVRRHVVSENAYREQYIWISKRDKETIMNKNIEIERRTIV
jgi:hypothetical protein